MQERDTPLHKAARAGNGDRIWALLESGQDPTAQDVKGRTPYAVASEKTARDTFRRSAGCCMHLPTCAGWLAQALHRAQTVGKSHAELQVHYSPGAAALPGLNGTSRQSAKHGQGHGHTASTYFGRIREVSSSFKSSFPGCRFMAHEPDKWDYAAAGIPSALTEEMELQQQAKQVCFDIVQLCCLRQEHSAACQQSASPG